MSTLSLPQMSQLTNPIRERLPQPGSPLRGPVIALITAVGTLAGWALAAFLLPKGLPLGILIMGIVFGSLYALVAIGIVLIYRANKVINFAQAEFGAIGGVLAIEARLQWQLNYFLCVAGGLIIAAVLGGLINALIIRRFRNAPRLILSVATIGLAQLLNGIAILIPIMIEGLGSGTFSAPLDWKFTAFPVIFNANHALALIVVPLVMAGLAAFLRFTDYGIVIRAAAENRDRAGLLGIPVPRLSTIVWALAGFLSALAVILRIPILGFTSFISVSGGGSALLLRTLAAAVIGRMESLPRTVIAAIGIGVFQEAANWQLGRTTVVDAMLVLIILVALLIQRDFFSRAVETGISSWKTVREVRPIPEELRGLPEIRVGFGAVRFAIIAFAVTFPLWATPSQEQVGSLVLIYSMVAVSLLVLTGWAGHISLGQFALVGFGGAATAVLYGRHGWDITLAIVAGIVVASLVALVIGLPALRIRGPFLAVTTLAFAVTSGTYFLEDRYFPWFIESTIVRPRLWNRLPLEEEWQMYLLSLVGLVMVMYAARNLRRSHVGRVLIAVRDNEVTAESVTLNATKLKLTAFMISGAMAGFAGALYVLHQRGLQTDAFGPEVSLRLFSMVVIGGLGSLPGAVMGAVYIRGAEFFLPPEWALIASGTGILLLLMFLPEGLGGLVYNIRDGILRKVAKRRDILVPSLVADRRTGHEDEAKIVIGGTLGNLRERTSAGETTRNGGPGAPKRASEASATDGDSDRPPDDTAGQDTELTSTRSD